jgi:hypothetical protein
MMWTARARTAVDCTTRGAGVLQVDDHGKHQII